MFWLRLKKRIDSEIAKKTLEREDASHPEGDINGPENERRNQHADITMNVSGHLVSYENPEASNTYLMERVYAEIGPPSGETPKDNAASRHNQGARSDSTDSDYEEIEPTEDRGEVYIIENEQYEMAGEKNVQEKSRQGNKSGSCPVENVKVLNGTVDMSKKVNRRSGLLVMEDDSYVSVD